MKVFYCILLAATLSFACNPDRKPSYDIDSVASEKGTEVFQPDWDNIAENYRCPEWFTDGKFGIFIHWGLYSVPAYGSEWYARWVYQQGSREYEHHREAWGDHTEFGYKDFVPLFRAEKFDADQWVALFKEAGAKYVVPVAEHHDGFSMYDSDLNEWNSVDMGPRRDIVGELKTALEKQDIVFGLSSHRAENAWFYNGGMKFPSDVQDSTITLYGRRFPDETYTEEFAREWLAHTYELVTKYKPSLFWFDWTVNNPVLMPYFNKFMAFYYNNALDWGEGVVVNTKQGYPTDVHVWDVERGKSDKMMQFPWQTDTAVGTRSWGYIEGEVYKTPGQIVDDLVDIVSKNGNLLLNIGPRPDGTIPEEQQEILRSIGRWLGVNGEAIYGTRPWKRYGEVETEGTKGSFSDNTATAYTSRDLRFTTRGNDLYVIALEWGEGDVTVRSLTEEVVADAKISDVKMLGSEETIAWEKTPGGLKLSFPSSRPCDYAYAFKISFDSPVGEHLPSEAVNEVMKHGAN
jgi:alpha-L-fucosidase